jgi:hypothetical protein
MLNEFYRIAFRKKIYATISELQKDLDVWMTEYNEASVDSGAKRNRFKRSGFERLCQAL